MSNGSPPASAAPPTPAGVDVIIPIYNAAEHIEECLQSLLAQTHPLHSIVIVDDCSSDNGAQLAQEFLADSTVPFQVLHQPTRLGAGAARNRGLGYATAELIWFVDADDTADPAALSTLVQVLAEQGAAVCRTVICSPSGTHLYIAEPACDRDILTGYEYVALLLAGRARAYPPTKLFRRKLLSTIAWDEVHRNEDLPAMIRSAHRARTLAVTNAALYRYRQHPDSSSQVFSDKSFDLMSLPERIATALSDIDYRCAPGEFEAFTIREAILPFANLAARAPGSELSARALARARSRSTVRLIMMAVRGGHLRLAATAAVLRLSPSIYAAIVRMR